MSPKPSCWKYLDNKCKASGKYVRASDFEHIVSNNISVTKLEIIAICAVCAAWELFAGDLRVWELYVWNLPTGGHVE